MFRWQTARGGQQEHGLEFPKEASLRDLRYAVLDTELTSLDQRSNRLLSIGGIAMDGSKIRMAPQFYRVVNPGMPIPAESVVIHRLRAEDVEEGEPLMRVLEDLRQFVEGAVIVGHFVNIDLQILRKELGGAHKLGNPAVDTARVHRWILRHGRYSEELPTQLDHLDLVTLASTYALEVHDVHHALHDAFLTARIWQQMIPILDSKGIRNLRQLLRIGGA